MDLEFHQLDRRYEGLRRMRPERERSLLASLAERGQQVPIVVVALERPQRYLVIDGFKRLRCLALLGRDTVRATLWDLQEGEALLLDRSQRSSEGLTELEQGWLLVALREQGWSQEELAKRWDKSASWVSRRLALVQELPEEIQEHVRQGALPAHAAMRHLVPLARRHREDCLRLASAIAGSQLTSREVGELCAAWLRSSCEVRERLLEDPRLFLRARQRRREPAPVPMALELLRDIDRMTQTLRQLRQRLAQTQLTPNELDQLHRASLQAHAELDTFDEEIHCAREKSSPGHSGTVREGRFEASHRQAASDLSQHREQSDPIAERTPAPDRSAGEDRALSRRDPGTFLDVSGQSRASPRGAPSPGSRDLILRPDRLLPPSQHRDEAQGAGGEVSLRAGRGDAARHLASHG